MYIGLTVYNLERHYIIYDYICPDKLRYLYKYKSRIRDVVTRVIHTIFLWEK